MLYMRIVYHRRWNLQEIFRGRIKRGKSGRTEKRNACWLDICREIMYNRESFTANDNHPGGFNMKDKSYLDTLNSVILKILLVVALFFPVSTTMAEAKHQQYFQEFLLVNAVAAAFVFFYVIALIFKRRWNRK